MFVRRIIAPLIMKMTGTAKREMELNPLLIHHAELLKSFVFVSTSAV